MIAHLCDQCHAELPPDKYFQIVVFEAKFGCGEGVGNMVTRIGGRHLCKNCAMGIAELVNGDTEIRNVRRHQSDIDKEIVYKMADEGLRNHEIIKKTGYSRTTVSRILKNRKKAAPEK